MVSKKNIIGLSMLLLVFLLSLSTTAYADVYREFEYTDLKNFLYNGLISRGNTIESSEAYVASLTDLQYREVAEALNTYDYCIVAYGYSCLEIRAGNTNYTSGTNLCTYLRNDGSQIINNSMTYTYGVQMYFAGNRAGQVIEARYGTIQINYIPQNLFYSSYDIFNGNYNGAASGTAPKIGEPPIYKNTSGFFSGIYQPEPDDPELYFEPIAPLGYRDFTVGQNLGLVVRGVTKNNTYSSMKFGDLYVPSYYYIKDIEVVWYYYNKNTGNWLGKYMLHEYGDDLTPDNYRSTIFNFKFEESYKENDTTIVHYSLWGNRNYVLENCVYQFEIQSTKFKDGLLEFDGNAFYILDNNTVIGENGVLDTGFLDTGPYSDEYLNDVNDVAKKVDELDDLINGVETGIGNLFIPESGDWFPLNQLASGDDLLNTALGWGFKNYDNPYWTALYGLMESILQTLTRTGNVEITFTLNGTNYTYNSDYVRLPDGPLKTWLSLATTFLFVVAIYRLFNRKLEKIKMADSTVLKYSAEDSNLL